MQKILLNLINIFIFNDFIDEKNALKKINEILQENHEKIIEQLFFHSQIEFDYEKHLSSINELRVYFSKKYDSSILIENAINNVLGKFIPSQTTINKRWISNDKYRRLLFLSLLSYYIKEDKNQANIQWEHESRYGKLKLSINNAKPEKTQIEISNWIKDYGNDNKNKHPKCDLCIENINFTGSPTKDSRENLRVIFTNLTSQSKWFFQYSPYVYLKDHFILSNFEHTPMLISNNTIKELVDFINQNNSYFLGSNSDLEIVGGSLLSHNHYQGGSETLPIMSAKVLKSFIFKETKIEVLEWPLNVVRISHSDKNKLINVSNYFVNSWKSFNKWKLKPINNTSTIIVNKSNNLYNVYLIFRNNSTSKEKPFGIYHINPSRFNIKQENIGLMEAAGLAILPKRLSNEIKQIITIMKFGKIDDIRINKNLNKHYMWISKLVENKTKITHENLLKSISNIFVNCLEDCKVLQIKKFLEFVEQIIFFGHEIYKITNNSNMKIEILSHGFTIKQIEIDGQKLLLEFKNIDSYFKNNDIFLNSFVGPVAGRIENGYVKLEASDLFLKVDKNNNYIHGMNEKWSDLIYEIEIKSFKDFNIIEAKSSQYNQELDCNYRILIILKISNNQNLLNFTYSIFSDKNSICNPTQHLYWKLPFSQDIFDLNLNFKSKAFWLLSRNFNPIERIIWTNNTTNLEAIKELIGKKQVSLAKNGIDHPIELLNQSPIILSSSNSNISIVMNSSLTNIVLYTHNSSSNNELLDVIKNIHQAICLEYQEIPTSKNNPNFRKITIKKNEPYLESVSYYFLSKK